MVRYRLDHVPTGTFTYCRNGVDLDNEIKFMLDKGVGLADLKVTLLWQPDRVTS